MNFNELFEKYSSYIYNYALKLSCDPNVAEDVAQETFLKAWRNQDQLRSQESLKFWLRKICLNCFLMKVRKEKGKVDLSYDELTSLEKEGSQLQISSSDASPEDEVMVDEAVKDIQNGCFMAMVRRLTPNQRMAFSLIDMFGLTMEEVAGLLGISKSAIKALLYRARMNLDDFFSRRCDLIKVDNPCNCKAWADFNEHRNDIKNKALKKKLISSLDYTKTNYTFNSDVRRKVQFLYSQMPEKKPSQEWYDSVIRLIEDIYEN